MLAGGTSVGRLACCRGLPASLLQGTCWLLFLSGVVGLLACWGAMHGHQPAMAWDQARVFWVTIWTVWLMRIATEVQGVSIGSLAKALVWGCSLYSMLKCAPLCWTAFDGGALLLGLLQQEMQIITCLIVEGVPRIQTSCDLALPLALYIVLSYPGWFPRRWVRGLLASIMMVALFFAFSRALLFMGITACLISAFHLGWRAALRRSIGCLLGWSVLQLGLGELGVQRLDEERFSGEAARYSDLIRHQQVAVLSNRWSDHPWLGEGFGLYSQRFVRSEKLPYSYEVQWLALLWQSGLIGWILWQGTLLALLWPLLALRPRTSLGLLILAGGYWMSGWTNPYVISLLSGVLYGMIHLLCYVPIPHSSRSSDIPIRAIP